MPIGKTPGVSDRDFRLREGEVRAEQERMQIIEALKHGNVYEVFAKSKTFKIGDFADFFASQWKTLKGQIMQDSEIKAMEGSCPEPSIDQFPLHHKGVAIPPEDSQMLGKALADSLLGGGGVAGKFKAQGAGDFASDVPDGGSLLPDELEQMVGGTLDDWDQFLNDTWGTIFDQQFLTDYQSRMGEIKREVQRIITLAKQGAIGPEFVLIALAKVNATKNGCLMTWLGKKASHINDTMSRTARDLHDMSAADPKYYQTMQMSQEKTREGGFQLNLLVQDMQKVMQDTAGTLEFVHSFMGEINRTRREIITKFTAH